MESEQGDNNSQEQDPEDDDNIEDDQSQDYRESFDNDQYGDNGYDSDAMDTSDSSEEEQDSDEDDDDDDDDDEYDDVDWETHNLFWFGTRELTFTPLPPLKPILKKPTTDDTPLDTPQKPFRESGKRRVTFFHHLPSYRWEKPADAPYWKRATSRSPILLGFH